MLRSSSPTPVRHTLINSSVNADSSSSSLMVTYSTSSNINGEWSGARGGGRIEPIHRYTDGEAFEIDDDLIALSMNAQKQDDSSEELTIQILQNGEVVAEQSTTAEYGVAQTSHSTF